MISFSQLGGRSYRVTLHRVDSAVLRKEPLSVVDNPKFLIPSLDRDPQPWFEHPRHRPASSTWH